MDKREIKVVTGGGAGVETNLGRVRFGGNRDIGREGVAEMKGGG
jgi:hypothetical protein